MGGDGSKLLIEESSKSHAKVQDGKPREDPTEGSWKVPRAGSRKPGPAAQFLK